MGVWLRATGGPRFLRDGGNQKTKDGKPANPMKRLTRDQDTWFENLSPGGHYGQDVEVLRGKSPPSKSERDSMDRKSKKERDSIVEKRESEKLAKSEKQAAKRKTLEESKESKGDAVVPA